MSGETTLLRRFDLRGCCRRCTARYLYVHLSVFIHYAMIGEAKKKPGEPGLKMPDKKRNPPVDQREGVIPRTTAGLIFLMAVESFLVPAGA